MESEELAEKAEELAQHIWSRAHLQLCKLNAFAVGLMVGDTLRRPGPNFSKYNLPVVYSVSRIVRASSLCSASTSQLTSDLLSVG